MEADKLVVWKIALVMLAFVLGVSLYLVLRLVVGVNSVIASIASGLVSGLVVALPYLWWVRSQKG